jgi:hypothetical protein
MPTLAEGAPHVEWLRRVAGRPQTPAASLRQVTPAELAAHTGADSAWVALRGAAGTVVYDVTDYARYHPGGLAQLLRGAGRDATELFASIHRWVAVEPILRGCEVGLLQQQGGDVDGGEGARADAAPAPAAPAAPCFLRQPAKPSAAAGAAAGGGASASPTAAAAAWARSMLLWSRRVWPADGGPAVSTSEAPPADAVTQLRFELPRGTRLGLTAPFGQAVTLRLRVRGGDGGSGVGAAAPGGAGDTLLHESGLRSPDGGSSDDVGCRASTSGVDLPCRVDGSSGCDDGAGTASADADAAGVDESEFGGLADDADERTSVVSGAGGDDDEDFGADDDGRSVTSLAAKHAAAAPVAPPPLTVRAPHAAPAAASSAVVSPSVRIVELSVWPASDPQATDFFDVFVAAARADAASALLLALQPGDTVEVVGPTGRLRPADSPTLPAAPAAPSGAAVAAGRLQRALTPAAYDAVASRALALVLPPSPSAPFATAAWPWVANRLASIGVLVQGAAGLAAALPLLHTAAAWARRRPHLAAPPITTAAPSPAPVPPPPAPFRVHVVVDASASGGAAAAGNGAADFPLALELAEVVAAARGAIVATVLLPAGAPAASPARGFHALALPSGGQPLVRALSQLQQQQAAAGAAAAAAVPTPLWPPPSEGTLLLLAGDAAFVAAGDDAARECYYLASQVLAVDVA